MRVKLLLIVLVSACGSGVATIDATTVPDSVTTIEAPTTTVETTAAAATTTTEQATTTSAAADAAPPELAGRWLGEMNGVRFILGLAGTTYSIVEVGGLSGNGRISVEGNRITFSDSSHGPGEGFYEWLIEGDTLTFTELEPPDNLGRKAALIGVTWTR